MKIARLVTALALVACAFTVNAGTPPQIPVSGGGLQLSIMGQTAGSWNVPQVPTQSGDGFATGTLTLGNGFPFYLMSLVLPEDEVTLLQGGNLFGTLTGSLFSFPLSPLNDPFADVVGTWSWDPFTGQGSFIGYVVVQGPPGSLAPITLLGVVGGRISDPATPFGPDILGSYTGRWFFY